MDPKGGALIHAMLATAAMSAFVAMVVQQSTIRQHEAAIEGQRLARNSLAYKISSELVTPSYLMASVAPNVSFAGNNLLRTCLGLDNSDNLTAVEQIPGQAPSGNCDVTGIDPNVGVPFVLLPDSSFVFNPQSSDAPGGNCPPSNAGMIPANQDVSCFLAGSKAVNQTVGYTLKGDTGNLSITYPFEVQAYFYPVCNESNPSQTKCLIAPVIQLRSQMIHHNYVAGTSGSSIGYLGTYPQGTSWITVNTIQVAGSQCNTGAKVTGMSESGFLNCTCNSPYRPLLGPTGNPMTNAKGPLCQLMNKMCPPGMVIVGTATDGTPMCEVGLLKIVNGQVIQTFDTTPASTGIMVSCNDQGQNGWIYAMYRDCKSAMNFTEQECPDGCGACIWCIVVGVVIGLLIAFFVTLAIGIILVELGITLPAGVAFIIDAFALLAIGLAGGVTGYILGEDYDWIFSDSVNGFFPSIVCTYQVLCAGLQ